MRASSRNLRGPLHCCSHHYTGWAAQMSSDELCEAKLRWELWRQFKIHWKYLFKIQTKMDRSEKWRWVFKGAKPTVSEAVLECWVQVTEVPRCVCEKWQRQNPPHTALAVAEQIIAENESIIFHCLMAKWGRNLAFKFSTALNSPIYR